MTGQTRGLPVESSQQFLRTSTPVTSASSSRSVGVIGVLIEGALTACAAVPQPSSTLTKRPVEGTGSVNQEASGKGSTGCKGVLSTEPNTGVQAAAVTGVDDLAPVLLTAI